MGEGTEREEASEGGGWRAVQREAGGPRSCSGEWAGPRVPKRWALVWSWSGRGSRAVSWVVLTLRNGGRKLFLE